MPSCRPPAQTPGPRQRSPRRRCSARSRSPPPCSPPAAAAARRRRRSSCRRTCTWPAPLRESRSPRRRRPTHRRVTRWTGVRESADADRLEAARTVALYCHLVEAGQFARAGELCAQPASLVAARARRPAPLPLPLRPCLRRSRRTHAGVQGSRARTRGARLSAAGRPRRRLLHPGEGRQRRGGMAHHRRLHQPVTLTKGVLMKRRHWAHIVALAALAAAFAAAVPAAASEPAASGAESRAGRSRLGARRGRRLRHRGRVPAGPGRRRDRRRPGGRALAVPRGRGAPWRAPRPGSPRAPRCATRTPAAPSTPRPARSPSSTFSRRTTASPRPWAPAPSPPSRGAPRPARPTSRPAGSTTRCCSRGAATGGSSPPTPTWTTRAPRAWRPRGRRAPGCAPPPAPSSGWPLP